MPSKINPSLQRMRIVIPLVVRQRILPRNPPFISPRHQPVVVSAGALRLPARHALRRIVHRLEVRVGETYQRLPQILKAVPDVVRAGAVVHLLAHGAHFAQFAVDGGEEG
jgi:hypothetical protein